MAAKSILFSDPRVFIRLIFSMIVSFVDVVVVSSIRLSNLLRIPSLKVICDLKFPSTAS